MEAGKFIGCWAILKSLNQMLDIPQQRLLNPEDSVRQSAVSQNRLNSEAY